MRATTNIIQRAWILENCNPRPWINKETQSKHNKEPIFRTITGSRSVGGGSIIFNYATFENQVEYAEDYIESLYLYIGCHKGAIFCKRHSEIQCSKSSTNEIFGVLLLSHCVQDELGWT